MSKRSDYRLLYSLVLISSLLVIVSALYYNNHVHNNIFLCLEIIFAIGLLVNTFFNPKYVVEVTVQ
jgi:hypothetical protein